MAGRYKQMTDPSVLKYRPYWQYKHSDAIHPRPLHLSWNGMVLSADDPWWIVHFPPNGWGCGCDVIGLSERQLKALGKSGPDKAPANDSYEDTDPRTGQPETRWPGIDRGWEYNPGREWLEGVVPVELRKPLDVTSAAPAELPALPEPKKSKADLLPSGLSTESYIRRFMGEFDLLPAEVGYHRDPSGGIVTISRSLFSAPGETPAFDAGRFALFIAEAIKDPDEIWAAWATTAQGAPILQRTYLRRFALGKAGNLIVQFVWTRSGWRAVVAYSSEAAAESARAGAMLYSRTGATKG